MADFLNLALCIVQIFTAFYFAKSLAALGAAGVPVPGAAAASALCSTTGAAFGASVVPGKQGSHSEGGRGHCIQ